MWAIKFCCIFLSISVSCYSQRFVAIKANDFASSNINLNEVGDCFNDVIVVGLGESTHSVGATFTAKLNVIKYLHENLGFDNLVFESGFYDCNKAYQMLCSGDTSESIFFDAIFGVWNTNEVSELFHYIRSTYNTKHPLRFSGMDIQFLNLSKKYFIDDFFAFTRHLQNCSMGVGDSILLRGALERKMRKSNAPVRMSKVDTTILSTYLKDIINKIDSLELDTSFYFDFWKRNCVNIVADYRKRFFKSSVRDSMMAQNTIWHSQNNADTKIILWSANTHLSRNLSSIQKPGYDFTTLGQFLAGHYKDRYYFIAFTQNYGRGGYSNVLSYKFKPASKLSVEYVIDSFSNKSDYIFWDIRSVTKGENNGTINTKFFGNKEIPMNIYSVCDGIFYSKEMTVPKYR